MVARLLALTLACVAAVLPTSHAGDMAVGGFLRKTLFSDGRAREYLLRFPTGMIDATATSQQSVVFALHCFGCDSSAVRAAPPALSIQPQPDATICLCADAIPRAVFGGVWLRPRHPRGLQKVIQRQLQQLLRRRARPHPGRCRLPHQHQDQRACECASMRACMGTIARRARLVSQRVLALAAASEAISVPLNECDFWCRPFGCLSHLCLRKRALVRPIRRRTRRS